jgi:hypothetical protein
MTQRLMGFQRDLLVVIAGSDHPSGQRIETELEVASDRAITHGRLYPKCVLIDVSRVRTAVYDQEA